MGTSSGACYNEATAISLHAYVCGAELEAQTGIAEKTLAEFIVDVAKGARNVDGFKKVRLPAWHVLAGLGRK
jgi:hypothetical protein